VNFYNCAANYQVSLSAHRESFVCAAITSAHTVEIARCTGLFSHAASVYSLEFAKYCMYTYIQRERESRNGEGAVVHWLGHVSVLRSHGVRWSNRKYIARALSSLLATCVVFWSHRRRDIVYTAVMFSPERMYITLDSSACTSYPCL
jgi:hypothetical protein